MGGSSKIMERLVRAEAEASSSGSSEASSSGSSEASDVTGKGNGSTLSDMLKTRIQEMVIYKSKVWTRKDRKHVLICELTEELKQLQKDGAKVEAQQLENQLQELWKHFTPYHNKTEDLMSTMESAITLSVMKCADSVSFPELKFFLEEACNDFRSRYGEPAAPFEVFLENVEYSIGSDPSN